MVIIWQIRALVPDASAEEDASADAHRDAYARMAAIAAALAVQGGNNAAA